MTFTPPMNEKIRAAFPEIADVTEFARGGFKVVYKAKVGTAGEVFKLVCLPESGKTDEERSGQGLSRGNG